VSTPRRFLKAIGKRTLAPAPPSAVQVECERSFWGANPVPGHTEAEDLLYLHGERFLMMLYAAVFGLNPKGVQFKKALGEGPSKLPAGWGDLARIYKAGGDPEKLVSAWEGVLDGLLTKLIPPTSTTQVVGAWAVRTTLLGKIGDKAAAGGGWPSWESLLPSLDDREAQVMKWTAQRGAQYLTNVTEKARASVMEELSTAAMEHLPASKLQQRLFDKFSAQNRDWRRVVLTETAFSVQNARLAAVDPKDGWDAVWTSGPKACPYCKKNHMRRFRLVDPAKKDKEGQAEIWVGKSNIGRSSSKRKKDGTLRTEAELWWPCLPAHPNCVCQWTVVRAKKFDPKKNYEPASV
jgi:hypothetical protein